MNDIPNEFPPRNTGMSRANPPKGQRGPFEFPFGLPPPKRQAKPVLIRTHGRKLEKWAKVGSWVSSTAAGLGAFTGLYEPADGVLHGVLMPFVFGGATAVLFGIGWHSMLTAAPRTDRVCLLIALGFGLSVAQIGTSSWGTATVISGHSALRQHRAEAIRQHAARLEDAHAGFLGESSLADAVQTAAAEFRGLSSLEAQGGTISDGPTGRGPVARLLATAADGYDRLTTVLRAEIERATLVRDRGRQALDRMQSALSSGGVGFDQRANEVEAAIRELGGIQLGALVAGGIPRVESWPARIARGPELRAGAERISARVLAQASAVIQRRPSVEVPTWTPIAARDAVRDYASESALGGWLMSISIDLLCYASLLLLICTRGEEGFESFDDEDAPPPFRPSGYPSAQPSVVLHWRD